MTIAQINKLILSTLQTKGAQRGRCIFDREISLSELVAVGATREAIEALCVPGQFTGAPLVKMDGDMYRTRMAADEPGRDRFVERVQYVRVRAVDATFHGAHYNAQGEAICLPEPY
jgi:hypothetical protein